MWTVGWGLSAAYVTGYRNWFYILIWPVCSGYMRISSLVPFGTGRPLGTEQGMKAGDLELSFWVRMDLVASTWVCSQGQSCSGYFLPILGGSFPLLAKLLPVSLTLSLVSFLGLASGAHHCTGIWGFACKWPAVRARGYDRQCKSRGHRLEDEAEGFGAPPCGGLWLAGWQAPRTGCKTRLKGFGSRARTYFA